jgi:hypothetical protein
MAEASFRVNIGDIDRFRLFVWELRELSDEMRVMASPHSERLQQIVDRFCDAGPLENDRRSER